MPTTPTDVRAEKEAASTASLRYQEALERDDHEACLRYIRQIARHLDRMEEAHVAAMRWNGATWNQVAAATGMNSRQAAYMRFGRDD